MLVLTWNLFHGRSVPDAPRSLLTEFAPQLAAWEWDVALLQEVPPWWPPVLGRACRASARTALTSRNWLLPVSRRAAERRPDLIKSCGGGANAILVRGEGVREHRVRTLRSWPERRVVHGVRLERGWWVVQPPRAVAPRGPRARRRGARRGHGDRVVAGRAGRAGRRPQHARSGGRGLRAHRRARRRPRPRATAARRGPGAYAGAAVSSRTTRRCWHTLPRKDRREEAS